MPDTADLLAERARYWRSASRYRTLSTLFSESRASDRFMAISLSIEMLLVEGAALTALADHLVSRSKVLCAEVETLLMRGGAARAGTPFYTSPPGYSAADMREEATLCREEVEDLDHLETRRSLAAAACTLAQLAEAKERGRA